MHVNFEITKKGCFIEMAERVYIVLKVYTVEYEGNDTEVVSVHKNKVDAENFAKHRNSTINDELLCRDTTLEYFIECHSLN